MLSSVFIILVNTCFVSITASSFHRPVHIIFILADDLGWNDISLHGSAEIPTPNIDALGASGLILQRHYAASLCTPSRASLMTGRYAPKTGLQHFVLMGGQPAGLPLNFTIMPQYFKKLGYATHAIGKWHLGYYRKEFTPIYRGFDTFFGYWNGQIDHYDYTHLYENAWGIDLNYGTETIRNFRGRFSAQVMTKRAEEIIRDHNPLQPLFLYLSQTVPHTGNRYQPLQAPQEHTAKFMHIKNVRRRIYAGSVSTLDESVGKVFSALNAKGMLDNSIILFISDNGGEVEGMRGNYGSNWPLRGAKAHMWEGGVRVPAVIWSPLLGLSQPRISTQLIHISDWLPTLYAAAGGKVRDLGNIDGVNMWDHLLGNLPSPRNEILLNVDPIFEMYALILNDFKLIKGTYNEIPSDNRDLWYGPSGRGYLNGTSMDKWVWGRGSVVKDILQRTGRWLINEPDKWRQGTSVDCGSISPPLGNGGCDPIAAACLFSIVKDPCEYRNLAPEQPKMVEYMTHRVMELNSTSMNPLFPPTDPNSDPSCYGFAFVPWLDREYGSTLCGLHAENGSSSE